MKRAAIAAFAALLSGGALAEGHLVTGKQLYDWARSPEYRAIFTGYVAGVHDVRRWERHTIFCTPRTGTTAGERAQAVRLWLVRNPELVDDKSSAVGLVAAALAETWPCRKP